MGRGDGVPEGKAADNAGAVGKMLLGWRAGPLGKARPSELEWMGRKSQSACDKMHARTLRLRHVRLICLQS